MAQTNRRLVRPARLGSRASLATTPPAWEVVRNFNAGTSGLGVQGQVDGLDDIAGMSTYSTEQSFEGGKSCKMTITGGTDGFGNWGGTIAFPADIAKGSDYWLDLYAFLPTGFNILTPTNGSLKFIRLRQTTAAAGHVGYFDLSLVDDIPLDTAAQYRMIKEDTSGWVYSGAAGLLTRNVWHRVSLHVVFDNVLQSSGGTARVRVWQDGVRLVDNSNIRTMLNATDLVKSLYLFTYWNGNSPQTQSLYLDNIRMASGGVPTWALDLT